MLYALLALCTAAGATTTIGAMTDRRDIQRICFWATAFLIGLILIAALLWGR